jgi:poly(A) polymerase
LKCFEGLEHCSDQQHHHRSYRTFALEYLESIVERWSRNVLTSTKMGQESSQSPTSLQGDRPRSFAAVVSSGSRVLETSTTTQISDNNNTATKASERSSNAWHRPPILIPPTKDTPPPVVITDPNTAHVNISHNPSAALIPFGSYRLGVHSTTSDLDLLALAPPYISRNDFFSSLVTILRDDDRCVDVHPIPTAYTPVIKFAVQCGTPDGPHETVQIDLVFARVADATKLKEYHHQRKMTRQQQQQHQGIGKGRCHGNTSPMIYYLDDTDLQDMDEIGVRSLNGARVSQMLLEAVQHDVGKFQTVLCSVKHWALVRGIYSNVLGFLGGVNWAILVAWVCRRYPDASASKTLKLFFHIFAKWQWNNPVLLHDIIADTPPICNVSLQARAVQLPAWNPTVNPRDGLHLMPIITPAYPSMNSSYNVDYPQLRCIQHEMIRTSSLLGRSPRNNTHHASHTNQQQHHSVYRDLFEASDFFQRHQHFLQINIRADNKEDFVKWSRLVESKIRNVISSLETTEVHAWPFARFFDVPKAPPPPQPHTVVSHHETCFFIGLRFAPDIDSVDIGHLTMDFLYKVNSWEGRKPTMDLSIAHITDVDVPLFVLDAMKDNAGGSIVTTNQHHPILFTKMADGSVGSENTAPATDDEEDDDIA